MKIFNRLLPFIVLLLIIAGCRKTDFRGETNGNQPPRTYTVVDSIFRSGDDRLTTTVAIQWWGDDPDGYITGYEFSFDEIITPTTNWIFTSRVDSVFLLAVPAGSDTFDFSFSVRAVDNAGLRDPNPARVKYPVKNSPPVVAFVYAPNGGNPLAGGNPVVSFPAVRYSWVGNDPDGLNTLAGYELFLNDTNASPYLLTDVFDAVILKATDLTGTISEAQVFAGSNTNPLAARISGMLLNDTNRLYIRAVDQSGAKSPFEVSNPIYIKKPVSRFLLVNAYGNDPNPDQNADVIDAFYEAQFAGLNISAYDKVQIFRRENNRFTRAFFIAFAIKVPMFPFHTWLPDAHVEAPTAGSVILAGVLLKMGTYGFLRFSIPIFPQATVEFVPFIFWLAVIGIIYGAMVSIVQPDIKKLVGALQLPYIAELPPRQRFSNSG